MYAKRIRIQCSKSRRCTNLRAGLSVHIFVVRIVGRFSLNIIALAGSFQTLFRFGKSPKARSLDGIVAFQMYDAIRLRCLKLGCWISTNILKLVGIRVRGILWPRNGWGYSVGPPDKASAFNWHRETSLSGFELVRKRWWLRTDFSCSWRWSISGKP
jgi:hypothetical protein